MTGAKVGEEPGVRTPGGRPGAYGDLTLGPTSKNRVPGPRPPPERLGCGRSSCPRGPSRASGPGTGAHPALPARPVLSQTVGARAVNDIRVLTSLHLSFKSACVFQLLSNGPQRPVAGVWLQNFRIAWEGALIAHHLNGNRGAGSGPSGGNSRPARRGVHPPRSAGTGRGTRPCTRVSRPPRSTEFQRADGPEREVACVFKELFLSSDLENCICHDRE